MARTLARLFLGAVLAAPCAAPAGCRRDGGSGPGVDANGPRPGQSGAQVFPTGSAAPAASVDPEAVPGDSPACADLRRRFKAALAAGSGRCASAGDCGCYNPVAPGLGCGGVTDATTSRGLGAIESDFHAAGCAWPHLCGPWSCEPACVAGRCRR